MKVTSPSLPQLLLCFRFLQTFIINLFKNSNFFPLFTLPRKPSISVLPFHLCLCLSLWWCSGSSLASQPGTLCPWHSVCVSVCLLSAAQPCQSTSLKYQLGTQTHNQNKLASLSMSSWAGAHVQECVVSCWC